MPRPWILAGFSGSGKSTVGEILARAAGRRFVDLDRHLGEPLVLAALADGEDALRALEAAALGDVLRDVLGEGGAVVVALGGGTLEGAASRSILASSGALVAWLDAPLETCLERCAAHAQPRPVLAAALAAGSDAVRALHARRRRAASLADHVVDASGEPEQVARVLLERFEEADAVR